MDGVDNTTHTGSIDADKTDKTDIHTDIDVTPEDSDPGENDPEDNDPEDNDDGDLGNQSYSAAELTGVDLAREALRAAQAAAKARGGRRASGGHSGHAASAEVVQRRRRRRWSGARADDRDPQPLGRLVSRVAGEYGWTEQLAVGQLCVRWPQLVGEDVAEHAQPVSLRDGELTVRADSTAWATQLRLLQRQLIAMIAKGIGHGVVTRMRIAGPSAPSWRRGPRHVRGRGPRDTYG